MEMIMRFNDSSDDVEIITKNESGNILGKLVNIKECANELVKVCSIDFDNLEFLKAFEIFSISFVMIRIIPAF